MPDVIGIDRFDDKLRFARWKKKGNNETATQWGARNLHFIEHVRPIMFESSREKFSRADVREFHAEARHFWPHTSPIAGASECVDPMSSVHRDEKETCGAVAIS